MAVDIDDPRRLNGASVIGADGTKLGAISAVYHDNNTGRPAWVAVRTGLFGLHVSLLPLAAAELRGEEVHVPYDKQQLRSAPHHDPGLELSPQDEMDLFGHYGLAYGDTTARGGTPSPRTGPAAGHTTGHTTGHTAGYGPTHPGPATDSAMTRSEEQLRVRTESHAAERVRLRKYVVTEYQQVTVPVRREEIRLEHEPVGSGGPQAAVAPGDPVPVEPRPGVEPADRTLSDDEHVVTLYEERPVVRTETVPVERVRLGKETVVEQQTVGGEVRREEIEVDVDPDDHGRR